MKVSVLGFGTVGKGVYDLLTTAPGFSVGKVLDLPQFIDADFKTSDINEIITDESVDTVVEAIGGIHPAYEYACAVLGAGKNYVTSNKALVADKGPELASLAEKHRCGFLFSAACGGAIPYLHNIKCAVRSGDTILSLSGILNGTSNYILDRMQSEGLSYDAALAEAQKLGYAEADPTADVSGLDTKRKILLACAVSYGMLPTEGVLCEGIESFSADDASRIKSLGYVCRLMANASLADGVLSAYVEPVICRLDSPANAVKFNGNMACYIGADSGQISLFGQGAGRYPTASAVMRDLVSLSDGMMSMIDSNCVRVAADNEAVTQSYYIRIPKQYAEGLFAEIISEGEDICGLSNKLSVASVHKLASDVRAAGLGMFFAAVEKE